MRSPAGRKVFRDFLRCEYSEENILFWLACEELKVETNAEKVEEKARFIYEDYISILSPKEVSIFCTHIYAHGVRTYMPKNHSQKINHLTLHLLHIHSVHKLLLFRMFVYVRMYVLLDWHGMTDWWVYNVCLLVICQFQLFFLYSLYTLLALTLFTLSLSHTF